MAIIFFRSCETPVSDSQRKSKFAEKLADGGAGDVIKHGHNGISRAKSMPFPLSAEHSALSSAGLLIHPNSARKADILSN